MSFNQANLTALIQTSDFSLWHYRTSDTRALVAAAGYFNPVSQTLQPGDLLLVQAVDSLILLPIRSGAVLGTGVTLDGAVGPVKATVRATEHFSFRQVAAAIVRSIVLAPLAAGLAVGAALPVSATVVGPISQVVFSVRDGTGAVIPPVQVVTVQGGRASASLTTPPVGTGYRVRVEDATDPRLGMTSSSFSIGTDLSLILMESNTHLLTEAGDPLLR